MKMAGFEWHSVFEVYVMNMIGSLYMRIIHIKGMHISSYLII